MEITYTTTELDDMALQHEIDRSPLGATMDLEHFARFIISERMREIRERWASDVARAVTEQLASKTVAEIEAVAGASGLHIPGLERRPVRNK